MTKTIRAIKICPCGCGGRINSKWFGLSRYGHGTICDASTQREALEGDFIGGRHIPVKRTYRVFIEAMVDATSKDNARDIAVNLSVVDHEANVYDCSVIGVKF